MTQDEITLHDCLAHQTTIIRNMVKNWAHGAGLSAEQWDDLHDKVFSILDPMCAAPYYVNDNARKAVR